MILALAVGCVTLPASIPNRQGKVTESDVATLLSIASPDLPLIPWLTLSQLGNETWRDCPRVYTTNGIAADAYDCVDSSGITWSGNASATATGTHSVITMSNFGPTGIEGGWIGNGTVDIESAESGGFIVLTRMQLDSWDGEPQTWWIDTEMGLGISDGRYYAEHYDGTIGLQDWGLATIAGNNVTAALPLGCAYADHGSGTMAIGGENQANFTFDAIVMGPPSPSPDTGGGDTGTATYPPRDSGDTGDTGGGSTSPFPDIDFGEADALCGVCTTVTIDGVANPGCVTPARAVAFAFPSIY